MTHGDFFYELESGFIFAAYLAFVILMFNPEVGDELWYAFVRRIKKWRVR